ncbi:MAG: helix-turn-helix transcriptional regulator [Ardenticatenaceae bacterium]|nr:helix-turn-helix transcriptional regulator [Ardenticatenaceae bacterium]
MSKFKINNNIRKLRFLNNEMTQQALAKQVGVTRQTIISLEKNKYSPSLELAFRIALVFDEPLTAVFSYDQSEDTE